ncbi:putative V-type proton ATPase subunit G [Clavispora lusitaniae]|uniref:V-type proton ATPase subunit G n=1 Tax=Clavispora lusitaniae TaxID=36911 RepID=A0ACD0WPN3_CLALS|nr:putative V-type proton ATPase subunit G [Clavispora lusitaniae]QFZ34854.1 putative V-type proton ATPase subunit G [Clavispora lusitaniae]QFZ40539.1 putative V-type proton ATPase subunit G [Clavispora lusitaniae]QFZ46219.1 putative V-type proton ATPase subunit G [Clavispora lusitaniae]QFZ51881.1 putative V-type proton ATPase subunit G [Clavispora lusitaniae]
MSPQHHSRAAANRVRSLRFTWHPPLSPHVGGMLGSQLAKVLACSPVLSPGLVTGS